MDDLERKTPGPLTTAFKIVQYLATHLAEEVKDLRSGKLQKLLKEMKEDLRKWKKHHVFVDQKTYHSYDDGTQTTQRERQIQ